MQVSEPNSRKGCECVVSHRKHVVVRQPIVQHEIMNKIPWILHCLRVNKCVVRDIAIDEEYQTKEVATEKDLETLLEDLEDVTDIDLFSNIDSVDDHIVCYQLILTDFLQLLVVVETNFLHEIPRVKQLETRAQSYQLYYVKEAAVFDLDENLKWNQGYEVPNELVLQVMHVHTLHIKDEFGVVIRSVCCDEAQQ